MHRDGRDAELLAGAQDPERDFAAIGDEDFFEHGFYRRVGIVIASHRVRPSAGPMINSAKRSSLTAWPWIASSPSAPRSDEDGGIRDDLVIR
jgi:hypothetical protein